MQVRKLSSGDPLTTHRELYLRNVSSKELKFNGSEGEPEEDLAPANRQQGDTIAFDKYCVSPSCACCIVLTVSRDERHMHTSLWHLLII